MKLAQLVWGCPIEGHGIAQHVITALVHFVLYLFPSFKCVSWGSMKGRDKTNEPISYTETDSCYLSKSRQMMRV